MKMKTLKLLSMSIALVGICGIANDVMGMQQQPPQPPKTLLDSIEKGFGDISQSVEQKGEIEEKNAITALLNKEDVNKNIVSTRILVDNAYSNAKALRDMINLRLGTVNMWVALQKVNNINISAEQQTAITNLTEYAQSMPKELWLTKDNLAAFKEKATAMYKSVDFVK